MQCDNSAKHQIDLESTPEERVKAWICVAFIWKLLVFKLWAKTEANLSTNSRHTNSCLEQRWWMNETLEFKPNICIILCFTATFWLKSLFGCQVILICHYVVIHCVVVYLQYSSKKWPSTPWISFSNNVTSLFLIIQPISQVCFFL